MKALVMFGLAYVAVPLSTMFGVQLPVQQEAVQEEPPLPVVVEVQPEPPKEKTIDDLLDQYFGDAAPKARKIMQCESGGNPIRHNYNEKTRDDSYGLFQVNLWGNNKRHRPSADQLVIPEVNIRFAADLYHREGNRFGTLGGWYNCSKKLGVH